MTRTKHLLAVGSTFAAFTLSACGDSNDDSGRTGASATATSTGTATQAPESVIAPDAEVADGLKRMVTVAAGVSRASDRAAAKQRARGLEPIWKKVEGTVKRNEPDLYATIEEDLSLLESGAPARTASGSREMRRTVGAYLAKHPG